jgi:SPP1 gp7 family putative phage head morphogenesis protein
VAQTGIPKQLYEPCSFCGGVNPSAESELPANFVSNVNKEIDRVIREIYDGKNIVTDKAILKHVGKVISSQVINSFGQSFNEIDYTTPDGEMLTKLTRDAWQFSAAKNYQQMRDISMSLVAEDGKLKSFNEFKKDAVIINDRFNNTWLKTEYDNAVGASTMAARWNDFEKNAEDQPYLRYSTAGDERVRSSHRAIDGVIRKITDAFWNTHFPPNGWRCRCDTDQLASSSAKETENIPSVPIPSMFQTNLARTGLIFPKDHPYYEGTPISEIKRAVLYQPKDAVFKNVFTHESGGKVDFHIMHGINEMNANIELSKLLAEKGNKVELLPIFNQADDDIREIVYRNKSFIKGKNPDALVNNVITDLKVSNSNSITSMHNLLRKAGKQANNVILQLSEPLHEETIKRAVKGQLKHSKNIQEVWVINDNEIIPYTRESLGL